MTTLERRLSAEWELLLALVERNPQRLHRARALDTTFFVTLCGPPTWPADRSAAGQISSHDICIVFPVHFPAVPMELYLQNAVLHPNVHPETGFICLWDRHRVSNTVEHALHKTVAMLDGRLHNADALHVMQPEALALFPRPAGAAELLLLGVEYSASWMDESASGHMGSGRKSRLS